MRRAFKSLSILWATGATTALAFSGLSMWPSVLLLLLTFLVFTAIGIANE